MMTFHDYLLQNLSSTVMISLFVDNNEPFQYNNWNWLWETSQFHLLKNDFSIGHIIHHGYVTVNEDGSISHTSKHHPKDIKMNFYFGGAINP